MNALTISATLFASQSLFFTAGFSLRSLGQHLLSVRAFKALC
jgi:hypothetical protein